MGQGNVGDGLVAGALGVSHSSAPFRNCTEALDTAGPSQSHEQAKYRMLFSKNRRRMPGPKGPSAELIHVVVEMKQRNPTGVVRESHNRSPCRSTSKSTKTW